MDKLTLEQARELRLRRKHGESIYSLARGFDINPSSVRSILKLRSHAYSWRQAVSDDEWDWLYEQSEAQGVSVQEYVRQLVRKEMKS